MGLAPSVRELLVPCLFEGCHNTGRFGVASEDLAKTSLRWVLKQIRIEPYEARFSAKFRHSPSIQVAGDAEAPRLCEPFGWTNRR
jgi:hypothetical protein